MEDVCLYYKPGSLTGPLPYSETKYRPSELKRVERIKWSQSKWFSTAAQHAPTNTWAEFGVGTGTTARHIAKFLDEYGTFYLFDSWEGLPEEWRLGETLIEPVGQWQANRLVTNDPRMRIVDGLFEAVLPVKFPEQLGLIHIDCDLYSSTKTVLLGCNKYIGEGTVLIFDEYYGYENYAEHERKACQEWLEATGKTIEWIGRDDFGAMGIVHVDEDWRKMPKIILPKEK